MTTYMAEAMCLRKFFFERKPENLQKKHSWPKKNRRRRMLKVEVMRNKRNSTRRCGEYHKSAKNI